MKWKKGVIALSVVAVIVVLMGVFGILPFEKFKKAEVMELETTDPIPVETVSITKGDITEITKMTALVDPKESVSVIPKLGGKVDRLAVKVGDKVTKGQLLVQLEQTELLAQLKQAEASLALAKTGESAALARLNDAKATLDRMETLFTEGAISKQQLEQAQLQYELSSPESVYAQIQQAQTGIEMIEVQLNNTTITAPVSGVVTSVNVAEGDMAGPSMPVVVIMDIDQVEVNVGVAEQYINNMKIGDKVDVKIAATSDEIFTGTIKTIPPAADSMTKMFPVAISLPNKGHKIKPGMFVDVALKTQSKKGVIIAPLATVVDQGSRQVIFVVEEGKAVAKHIELGINDGHNTEVLKGIKEGDQIIIKGQNIVNHGDLVTIIDGNQDKDQDGDQ